MPDAADPAADRDVGSAIVRNDVLPQGDDMYSVVAEQARSGSPDAAQIDVVEPGIAAAIETVAACTMAGSADGWAGALSAGRAGSERTKLGRRALATNLRLHSMSRIVFVLSYPVPGKFQLHERSLALTDSSSHPAALANHRAGWPPNLDRNRANRDSCPESEDRPPPCPAYRP